MDEDKNDKAESKQLQADVTIDVYTIQKYITYAQICQNS